MIALLSRIPRPVLYIAGLLILAGLVFLATRLLGDTWGAVLALFGVGGGEAIRRTVNQADTANRDRVLAQVQAEAIAREAEIQARRAEAPVTVEIQADDLRATLRGEK